MANCNKNDASARMLWGQCYDSIPKSVFAVVAFYFLERCDGEVSLGELAKEIDTLALNGIIDRKQANRCISAILKDEA